LLRGDPSLASEAFWSLDTRALFDAVAEVLTRSARQAPLLVIVDDLQWSDTMSLRLLSFLVRRLAPSASVCFMAAVRAEELAVAPFLRTVLQELEREQRFLAVDIAPLTRAHSKSLVVALAQSSMAVDPSSAFEPIWAVSEGNPLVIVETVHGLTGASPAAVARLPVPPRIGELIQRQLAPLDALAQEVLATAAVIGREFDFPLLHAAYARPPRELATTLEALVRMRILTGVDDAFYFTHDRVREVVYAGLSPLRRKVLHDAVAHGRAYFVEERRRGWPR
jgi:predicted ATPase